MRTGRMNLLLKAFLVWNLLERHICYGTIIRYVGAGGCIQYLVGTFMILYCLCTYQYYSREYRVASSRRVHASQPATYKMMSNK
jgi:hypothetical protein